MENNRFLKNLKYTQQYLPIYLKRGKKKNPLTQKDRLFIEVLF